MSLYPRSSIDLLSGNSMFSVPSGCLAYFPFVITTMGSVLFSAAQVAPTQDFSMKMWFSTVPDGNPLGRGYNEAWNLIRTPQLYAIYDATVGAPMAVHAFGVAPGNYVLNILNLINSENVFALSQTGLF